MRSILVLAALTLSALPVAAQQVPTAPAAEEAVAVVLERRTVTLNFPKATMAELADLMSDLLSINVVVAQECAGTRVTLHLRDVTAKAALATAARAAGLELSIGCGVVFLHPAGKGLGPVPVLTPDLKRRTMTFQFYETPVAEALLFFRDLMGANVATTAAVDGGVEVTVRARDLPLDLALALFARQAGLSCRMEDGVLLFDQTR